MKHWLIFALVSIPIQALLTVVAPWVSEPSFLYFVLAWVCTQLIYWMVYILLLGLNKLLDFVQ